MCPRPRSGSSARGHWPVNRIKMRKKSGASGTPAAFPTRRGGWASFEGVAELLERADTLLARRARGNQRLVRWRGKHLGTNLLFDLEQIRRWSGDKRTNGSKTESNSDCPRTEFGHSARSYFRLWHEAAVPAACAMFRSWGESGCAIGAAVSSAHDPETNIGRESEHWVFASLMTYLT